MQPRICFLLVVLSTALIAQTPRQTPRVFLLPLGVKPASRALLESWLEAVAEHQPGEADAAAYKVRGLSPIELGGIVERLLLDPRRDPSGALLPPDTLKRAAVLHTDVATMDVLMTKMPDVTWKYEIASLHFGAAKELVDFWRSEAGRDAFVRLWYRTTSAFLVSQYEITAAPVFLPQAVSVCRGDAHLPLMAGAVHELLASPRVQHASDVSGETREAVGPETVNLDKAETRYRQALRASPSLTEARIRLGRVLGQQGRHQQALAELKRAVSEPVPPPLRYLVYLLLGEEEEALNHRDAAREAYEHARALYPGAQSVHLALSRLERRYGDGSRAVAAIWQMFEPPPTRGNRDDPWREYYTAGQGRRAAELLEELRTPFRRRQ